MPYTTLSEQIKHLTAPQRSDTFVKRFREAVRTGELEAAQLPVRFTLPKAYRRRGSDEPGTRQAREMIFELTPEYQAWFERVNADLAAAPARGARAELTVENIEAGVLDFKALADETRRKIQARYEKGQKLGQGRAGAKGATVRSARARPARKAEK